MVTIERNNTPTSIHALTGGIDPNSTDRRTPTQEQIAQKAYERWERGGRQPGMAELDWIRAEEELTGAYL